MAFGYAYPFFSIKYSRGGPHYRDFIKKAKKNCTNVFGKMPNSRSWPKKAKEKQSRRKQEALHKEEKQLVWPLELLLCLYHHLEEPAAKFH
jgi:hypothetical protein